MTEDVTPTKSDPPPSKGKYLIDRLNAYRNIILATAALATAIGSWLKPTDTTATKQSFDWTTQKVQELSKNDVQMHDDIVALRAYLEGMRAAQPIAAASVTPAPVVAAPVVPVGRIAGGARRPVHRPRPPEAMYAVDQLIQAPLPVIGPFATEAPELPTLKADPHPMQRPSFEDVALNQ
jgi:hypothetical protein